MNPYGQLSASPTTHSMGAKQFRVDLAGKRGSQLSLTRFLGLSNGWRAGSWELAVTQRLKIDILEVICFLF
jgi:hypothetical protein